MAYISVSSEYPLFGKEINCPHCRQTIAALILTDSYLCPRHGIFEVDSATGNLVHLQSERQWRLWESEWHRQHNHPDGIRFEIHEAVDRLYMQGFRTTKVTIARRYELLMTPYLERSLKEINLLRLYGLPVEFSPEAAVEPRWGVINFELEKEDGPPKEFNYGRSFI
ncbi:MAG: TIGR02652 family protein [Pseudanabaenaceae cyanobacterium]|jgi:uncharacterized protein (TIGR02652 family)